MKETFKDDATGVPTLTVSTDRSDIPDDGVIAFIVHGVGFRDDVITLDADELGRVFDVAVDAIMSLEEEAHAETVTIELPATIVDGLVDGELTADEIGDILNRLTNALPESCCEENEGFGCDEHEAKTAPISIAGMADFSEYVKSLTPEKIETGVAKMFADLFPGLPLKDRDAE